MKTFIYCIVFIIACEGCAKQPTLPQNSHFNVTSTLNDTVWYGTGKVLRLKEKTQKIEDVRQFNLLVFTDIDYPAMGTGPNPNTENGCNDPECTRTQMLLIFNIPLKKGRYKIPKYDENNRKKNEYARHTYIGNAGGVVNEYVYRGSKPGWLRVTKYDKTTGIIEGRFALTLDTHTKLDPIPLGNSMMPSTTNFTNGLFRIKLTDVVLK